MTRPNFFIVGAPKCGTTALAAHLAGHPNIFVSSPKEPNHYLHPEADNIRACENDRHYEALFERAGAARAVGEASVWYLFSDHAREEIARLYPDARIVVMTRDPADFVASLHSQQRFGGFEAEADIALAWRRSRESEIPADLPSLECLVNWRTRYSELVQFEKYIDRWRAAFSDEQVLVIPVELMRTAPQATYQRVLAHLHVADDGRENIASVNANKRHRVKLLGWIMHALRRNEWLLTVSRRLKAALGIHSFGIYPRLHRLNTVEEKRAPMPSETRSEIHDFVSTR